MSVQITEAPTEAEATTSNVPTTTADLTTDHPTNTPTDNPVNDPMDEATNTPTVVPTMVPTVTISDTPTLRPSPAPVSAEPSLCPSAEPSLLDSASPSQKPSVVTTPPSTKHSSSPSDAPTDYPSLDPSVSPSAHSEAPTPHRSSRKPTLASDVLVSYPPSEFPSETLTEAPTDNYGAVVDDVDTTIGGGDYAVFYGFLTIAVLGLFALFMHRYVRLFKHYISNKFRLMCRTFKCRWNPTDSILPQVSPAVSYTPVSLNDDEEYFGGGKSTNGGNRKVPPSSNSRNVELTSVSTSESTVTNAGVVKGMKLSRPTPKPINPTTSDEKARSTLKKISKQPR